MIGSPLIHVGHLSTLRWILGCLMIQTLLILCVAPRYSTAQQHSHFASSVRASWTWSTAVGLRVLYVPQDIAEEEINKAPSVDASFALALPASVDLRTSATVQYLTNEFRLGSRWSVGVGSLRMGIANDISYWFGFMDFEGFDNHIRGMIDYPSVDISFHLDDVASSLRFEGIYVLNQRSFAGELEVGSGKNFLAGWAVTAMVEQPFIGHTPVYLGARIAFSEFHPQTWFAFSTFKRKLLYSELLVGVLL